jgi:hypothetical protein
MGMVHKITLKVSRETRKGVIMKLFSQEQGSTGELLIYEGGSIDAAMLLIARRIIAMYYQNDNKSVYFTIKDERGFVIFDSHFDKTGIVNPEWE